MKRLSQQMDSGGKCTQILNFPIYSFILNANATILKIPCQCQVKVCTLANKDNLIKRYRGIISNMFFKYQKLKLKLI